MRASKIYPKSWFKKGFDSGKVGILLMVSEVDCGTYVCLVYWFVFGVKDPLFRMKAYRTDKIWGNVFT